MSIPIPISIPAPDSMAAAKLPPNAPAALADGFRVAADIPISSSIISLARLAYAALGAGRGGVRPSDVLLGESEDRLEEGRVGDMAVSVFWRRGREGRDGSRSKSRECESGGGLRISSTVQLLLTP